MKNFVTGLMHLTTFGLILFCSTAFLLGTPIGLHTLLWALQKQLPGQLHIEKLQGRLLDQFSFKTLQYNDQHQHLEIKDGQFSWDLLHWLRTKSLNTHFTWRNHQWTVNNISIRGQGELTVTGLWPHQLKPQLHLNLTSPLATQVLLTGHLTNLSTGQMTIHASAGYLFVEKKICDVIQTLDQKIECHTVLNKIYFKGGELQAQMSPTTFSATGQISLSDLLKGDLSLRLHPFDLKKLADSPLQAKFNLKLPNLQFLSQKTTQIQGQINLILTAQGTFTNPLLSGEMVLNKGYFENKEWGIVLSPIHATLTSQNNRWQMTSFITVKPEGKILTIEGQGDLSQGFTGQWTLKGNNVLFINTPEYKIWVSPTLQLALTSEGQYTLTGHVLIPNAEIKPLTFTESEHLTDDAVFAHAQQQPAILPLNTNVQLEMGPKVAIQIQGLHGLLRGTLNLLQTPTQALAAQGILTLQEGRYQSYGQQLQLEAGELIFFGETLDNPKVNIRAIRQINHTKTTAADVRQLFNFSSTNLQNINYSKHLTVGIQVSGRIKTPKVTLFSRPSLSDADVLSFLLLGKPADQASRSGAQLLVSAVNALNLDSTTKGARLLQDLKTRLNLDFDFQTNTQASMATNALNPGTVGIGKSITDRVYLHYSVDLFQDNNNVLTLTYLLNKFFSIQVSTSDIGNGIDLLYTQSQP